MDELITQEFIERLKADDERWRVVDIAIKIDEELRSSTFLKLLLDKVSEEAAEALEELANTDPTDVKRITYLQAKVFRDRFIGRTLLNIRAQGNAAYESLREEGSINPQEDE